MATVIRVENLSKRYRLGVFNRRVLVGELKHKLFGQPEEEGNAFWSLKDISFDVKEGEVVGLLGHNGAGKSTLLKIISQITNPTSGRICLRGRVASLLEVGPGFHPELTGRDNVYVNGTILGMRRREVAAKFDEIVAFSGVEAFIDTPVKRYSVGMRVRLAFAIAAHLEPEILVVDEVLAVGDAAFQQKCLGKIDEVAHSGRTVLFVSHNAAAIEALCTRGIVLEKGGMIFDGTQSEAIEFYAASRISEGTDLSTRADRTGSGELRATSIELRNARGQTVPVARAGEDMEIVLHFKQHSPKPLTRLCAQLAVTTHLGAPVFTHSNWLTGDQFGELPDQGTLVCRIPKLPLPVGHYRLGFSLLPDTRKRDAYDVIDNAFELHVESGNFYGTGKLPPLQAGVCLVDGTWRIEQGGSLQTA
ncbi:MAG: ABC transporter ATP-binding protein [Verrucomicrobiaceae bacterium]|nr:MAG: ABC transporter ATP-binding protein [Verrucomicrobiaceae bacterium]